MARKLRTPLKFTPQLGEIICSRLEQGRSLSSICKDKDIPVGHPAVFNWARKGSEGDERFAAFADSFARAREIGLLSLADEIVDIADDNSRDVSIDEDGNETVNHDVINRARLRIDTRKWLLSQLMPAVYGKVAEQQAAAAGGNVTVNIVQFSEPPEKPPPGKVIEHGRIIKQD